MRTPKGPRQRVVANIEKDPGLDEREQLSWEQIGRILDGEEETKASNSAFSKRNLSLKKPLWANVNLRSIQMKRLRLCAISLQQVRLKLPGNQLDANPNGRSLSSIGSVWTK